MKKDAVLINTSRGGIVAEPALVDALRAGHLAGAAVDVFAAEPVDAATGARFAGVPNLILTPHIAGLTVESNARVGMMTAASVRRVLVGE
jgi:(S)-sulfolactate dehydrogenase